MDNKNFAIGVLSTTAVMLFVGLAVIHTRPTPVLADGMTVHGGDYEMTVGALDDADEELVYILDSVRQRMIAYRFNSSTDRIEIVAGLDLAEIRAQAQPKSRPAPPARNRRRRP